MAKGYTHVEVEYAQASKRPEAPCGDVVAYERTLSHTTIVLADGLGSGVKANIAAHMCVSRVLELLRQGYSIRKAFASLVRTMNEAREGDLPFAAFTVLRILNDGMATVLSYEMPPPIFATAVYANVLPYRTITLENALIHEASCHVAPGQGIIIVSDGITQAGLGAGLAYGWSIEGASSFINDCLSNGSNLRAVPTRVLRQAKNLCKTKLGDDCTAVLASCRMGRTVNILTGPPQDKSRDAEVVDKFLNRDGIRVVSGGTTSKIVADHMETDVTVEVKPSSVLAPPKYEIDGIDLVTEGAITLNQMFNVWDEDPSTFEEESGVTELHKLLSNADRVNIMVGTAVNPATADIAFRQKGILTRPVIIPLIEKKLREAGKLVVTEYY